MKDKSKEMQTLIVYGHDYCPQSQMMAGTLKKHQIDHEWRDVMHGKPHFKEELKDLANGCLSVPTLIFPDGTVMVEPGTNQVLKKLGIKESSGGGIMGLFCKI